MTLLVTILQLLCGLIVIGIVLFQSGKSAGLSGAIGGVADSFPIEHVLEEACLDRAVVIVMQDRSFVKDPNEILPAARPRDADYPVLLAAIDQCHARQLPHHMLTQN